MHKFLLVFSIISALFLFPIEAKAQDSIVKKIKKQQSKISKSAEILSNSISENDEQKIAKNYENLANQFILKGDNPKAEEYLQKALISYTKQNLIEDKVRVTRSLAKVQETQNKFAAAATNYKSASINADNSLEEKVNLNDYNRMNSNANPRQKLGYSSSNIALLEKEKDTKKEEIADAYIQQAENNLELNNTEIAVQNYTQAINLIKDKPEEVLKIQNKIASAYADDKQFDKAIDINQQLLATAKTKSDFTTQITQLQSLGKVYLKQNQPEKAVISLKEAYLLAVKKGNSAEAKKSLSQLIDHYKSTKNNKEILVLYEQFFQNFDQLIQADTSLIDAKSFQIIEEKITQLEKEKALKDELISKKNKFNYFLIFAVMLLLILFGFIAKALFAIKKKNKKIALQSLRREMNPHFIFNSLNSVNQFISENNELEANKYLTSYSNLMRTTMEYSNKDFIYLSIEIEQLKKYLALEHLRFQDKFDYEIIVDDAFDTEPILVPNMILQPQLENAIWHGLRYLETKGKLELRFEKCDKKVRIIIDDNGIGLTKSAALKTQNQLQHKSRGMKNTTERIALLNDLYQSKIEFKMTEKMGDETGTIVEIIFPMISKI